MQADTERVHMGMFDMSPLDLITKVTDFSQRSLENTLGTIKEVHQTIVEIPIDVARELGLPDDKSTMLKETHRRVLDRVHEGVCDACGQVNRYIVEQAKAVNQLADYAPRSAEPKVVEMAKREKPRAKKLS